MGKFSSFLKGVTKGAKEAAEFAGRQAFGGVAYKAGLSQEIMKELGEGAAKRFVYTNPHAWKTHTLLMLPNKIIKETPGKGFLGYSLSGTAYGIAAGTMVYNEVNNSIREHNREMLGTISGMQEMPLASYDYAAISEYDTGASGDLVFALNKLR